MVSQWRGGLALNEQQVLHDITLTAEAAAPCIPFTASLRFLSIVEVDRIPLYLSVGKPYDVVTSQEETARWFSTILLGNDEPRNTPWWQNARTESPLGVLAAVDQPEVMAKPGSAKASTPRVTEVLFFAAAQPLSGTGRPLTPPHSSPADAEDSQEIQPQLRVHALPICSDFYLHEPTPPPSPGLEGKCFEATFLPLKIPHPIEATEVINRPPVRKRKSANEVFEEATERQKKARRQGGGGVSAAAASLSRIEEPPPNLNHRRSISNTQSAVPLQNRPLSRSSSVASVRPGSVREPSVSANTKRSGLSRLQSVSDAPMKFEESPVEKNNKEFICKVVSAGMRLYGIVQPKTRKSRANSMVPSAAEELPSDELELEKKSAEEFKLVYSHAYKGTCFAFRKYITDTPLQAHTEALRATVDRLLAVYCNDPLTLDIEGGDDGFTPGGRKAFGSSALPGSEKNPFLHTAVGNASKTNTPCIRKVS
ncbi:uncharacterized protein RCC_09364 [Ramularia collo-cygni]|uniref:Sld7 C-terminal domain-containing protein n=1 Tax=Ramularia collo-cygni TaxID=112498 RepID=A0A2D3V9Q5_9PEZI|nr:uncharacterized protein RCC_09364 [Ramularia collo-cygni]CZT23650.1 uncharacterized protein RCC_09364 [Ramularia collo-cygni]